MADCESILRWLAEKSYRVVNENHPAWGIVNRLVDEGGPSGSARLTASVRNRCARWLTRQPILSRTPHLRCARRRAR